MKKEIRVYLPILVLLVTTILYLSLLFNKYSVVTIQHFLTFCRESLLVFILSGTHLTGLGVMHVVLFVVISILFITIVSILKTWIKLHKFRSLEIVDTPELVEFLCRKHKISKVKIYNDIQSWAYCIGFLKPNILVSSGLIKNLETKEIEAVLLHETHHQTHRHPLLALLTNTISNAFFFVPIISELCTQARESLEISADLFVVEIQGDTKYLKTAINKVSVKPMFDVHLTGFANWTTSNRVKSINSKADNHDYRFKGHSLAISTAIFMISTVLLSQPTYSQGLDSTLTNYSRQSDQIVCQSHENMSLIKNFSSMSSE